MTTATCRAGTFHLREGLRSAVATPIHVDGRLWGMIAVGSGEGPLPSGTEQRMSEFTDLVATAVANAQNRGALEASRDELTRLLAEQAALRRVATLVARGVRAGRDLLGGRRGNSAGCLTRDNAGISRFEPDGAAVVIVGSIGEDPVTVPVGTRVEIPDYAAPGIVWRTGRSAQVDEDVWSRRAGPGRRPPARAGHPLDGGEPDHRRGPPVGRGDRVDQARAVSCRHRRPPGGLHRARSPRPSGTPRAGPSWPPRGRGSSRPRIRPGGGSSGTCTTGPSNAWSRSASSFASRSPWCPPGCAELETEIGRVADELDGVVEDLREIARGIHPAILSEGGLGPALRTLARRAAIAVELDVAAD